MGDCYKRNSRTSAGHFGVHLLSASFFRIFLSSFQSCSAFLFHFSKYVILLLLEAAVDSKLCSMISSNQLFQMIISIDNYPNDYKELLPMYFVVFSPLAFH